MVSARQQRDPATEEQFMGALYKGGELLASGKVVEAREHLEKAHHLEPRNEKAQNLLGLAYFKLGLFEQAAQVYELLVRENPADPTLRVNLGLVYLKTQDLDRSVKEFETATDLDPGHKKAHNYLGLALAQQGQYERAREHFVHAGSDQMAEKMERAASTKAPSGVASRPSRTTMVFGPSSVGAPSGVSLPTGSGVSRASRVAPLPLPPPPPPPEEETIDVMSDDEPPPAEAEEVRASTVSAGDWGREAITPVPAAPPATRSSPSAAGELFHEAPLMPVEGRSEPVAVQLEALPADGDQVPVLEGTVVEGEAVHPQGWATDAGGGQQLQPMWVTETVQDVPLEPAPAARAWSSRPSAASLEEAMSTAGGDGAFSEAEAQALLQGEAAPGWEAATEAPPPEGWPAEAPGNGAAQAGWESAGHEDTMQSPGTQGWDGSVEPAPPGGWSNGGSGVQAAAVPPVEQGWFDDVEQPAPPAGDTTLSEVGWPAEGTGLQGAAAGGWTEGPGTALPVEAAPEAGWEGHVAELDGTVASAPAGEPGWDGQAEGLAARLAAAEARPEAADGSWEGQAEGLEATLATHRAEAAAAAVAMEGWSGSEAGAQPVASSPSSVVDELSWEEPAALEAAPEPAEVVEAVEARDVTQVVVTPAPVQPMPPPEHTDETEVVEAQEAPEAPVAEVQAEAATPPPPPPEEAPAEGDAEAAFAAEAPLEEVAAAEALPAAEEATPPEPGMVPVVESAQETEWVMSPVSEALRGAPTPRPSAPPDATIPPTLSVGFAPLKTQRLTELGEAAAWVQEPGAGPFQLGPAGLAVSVHGEMLTRMTGLVAVVGSVESEPEVRRRRGRPTGDAFGLGGDQLQRVRGHGVLYLEANQSFHAVDLTDTERDTVDDEGAYLREEMVFAFEEGLSYDNGRLSNEATALELVHLKGNGRVLLRLTGALSAMPVPPGTPTMVPVARLVGWFGRVAPRLTGFGGQGAVELTGEGYALLLT